MNTLTQEWQDYKKNAYPQGVSGIQETETYQAFFAGALVALQLTTEIADAELPTEVAVEELRKLNVEGLECLLARLEILRNKNRMG